MSLTIMYKKVVSNVLMMTMRVMMDNMMRNPFHSNSSGVGYVSCAGSFLASWRKSPRPKQDAIKMYFNTSITLSRIRGLQQITHYEPLSTKDNQTFSGSSFICPLYSTLERSTYKGFCLTWAGGVGSSCCSCWPLLIAPPRGCLGAALLPAAA